MPFGGDCEYADMDACIAANQDKGDPQGYCATVMRETEEACAARSVRMFRTKVMRPDIKVLDEATGRVSAIVSSETIDRDGDVIRAEGWNLGNFSSHPVLLSSHDYHSLRSQIGVWESMDVVGTRMKGIARFFIGRGNEEADWAFELAKEKALAFSVGFIPDMDKAVPLHKDDSFGIQGMEYKGQELLEVSAVTVPSNPDALQRMVKSPNLHPVMAEIAQERLVEKDSDSPTLSEEQVEHIIDVLSEIVLDRLDSISDPAPTDDDKGRGEKPKRDIGDAGDAGDDENPDPDDEAVDEDDYGDGDKPEDRQEFDAYAEAAAATEAALEEVLS